MKRYILKQLLLMIPAVLAVTIVAFALIRLMPSDAVNTYLLANHLERNEENIAIAEKRFGLDEPAPKQYLHWMQNVLRLDFGESYLNRQDVASMLKNAFLATLRLALASMVWILVLTPLLGIGAAAKPGGLTDKFTRFYCLCGTAIPTFVLGFLLIRLFAVRWRILPAISDGTLKSYLLPSFTLSLSHIAYFVQMLRNEMLENRSGAFVLYARARGIGEKRIFRWSTPSASPSADSSPARSWWKTSSPGRASVCSSRKRFSRAIIPSFRAISLSSRWYIFSQTSSPTF